MSQSEQFGEAWGHIRDNARPVIADDVYFLDEARADMPPSKAHLRRLARSRPTVTTPTPWGTSSALARRRANEAAAHGERIAALLGKVPYKPSPPERRERVYVEPEGSGSGKVTRPDAGLAARRSHMIAMSKMVYREYSPSHDEIVAVFGSLAAWSKARA